MGQEVPASRLTHVAFALPIVVARADELIEQKAFLLQCVSPDVAKADVRA
jgi:hypothetical protein